MTSSTMAVDERTEIYLTLYWTLGIALFAFNIIAVYVTVFVILRASSSMHNDVFNLILHSPMLFFDTTPIGRITNRMAKDIDDIDNYLPLNLENCLRNFFRVFGAIIFICIAVPYYIFAAVLQTLVLFLFNAAQRKVIRAIKRLENIARSPVYSHLATSLQGMACIRTFGEESNFQAKFQKLVDKNIVAEYMFWATTRWFSFYSDMVCVSGVIVISVIAILLKDIVPAAILGLCITFSIRVSDDLQLVGSSATTTNI